MRKLLFITFLFSFLVVKADYFDVTKDGSIVVIREYKHNDRLFVYNIALKQKKEILIPARSSEWVKIIRDSLVMVQYTHGSEKVILYSLQTGNKVFSAPINCFPDGSENFLYYINSDWQLNRYDLNDYQSHPTPVILEKPKGYEWSSNYFKISRNNARLALVINNKKKSTIAIYDVSTGKLLHDFDDFDYYFPFSTSNLQKDGLVYFDLNSDGTQLVAGNEKWARLYDVNQGKRVAEFEESRATHREGFGNAVFSANDKTVYLHSRYRLYFMNSSTFTPESNIIVGGVEQINGSESYLKANFTWNNIALTKNNRYLFSIWNPSFYWSLPDKRPVMMRKDITIPDPNTPLTFYYK